MLPLEGPLRPSVQAEPFPFPRGGHVNHCRGSSHFPLHVIFHGSEAHVAVACPGQHSLEALGQTRSSLEWLSHPPCPPLPHIPPPVSSSCPVSLTLLLLHLLPVSCPVLFCTLQGHTAFKSNVWSCYSIQEPLPSKAMATHGPASLNLDLCLKALTAKHRSPTMGSLPKGTGPVGDLHFITATLSPCPG